MRLAKVLALISFVLLPTLLSGQPAQRVADLNTTRTGGTDIFIFRTTFASLAGRVHFQVDDGRHGMEPWRTDGTEAGTGLVRDVCPGVCSSNPAWQTVVGGAVFFTADDGEHGRELWTTDGTAAGTVLVADLAPGLTSSNPYNLEELNGKLLFTTGNVAMAGGGEVWISDGTAAGTFVLVEIEPGPEPSRPAFLGQAGSFLLFSAAKSTLGRELWRTDGTSAGTTLVADLNPGAVGSLAQTGYPYPRARYAVASGGRVFFAADDGTHGLELWVSDGTAAGTILLGDLNLGDGFNDGSNPYFLVPFGAGVLFRADDGVHGYEPWASDGTPAGTHLVADVIPGIDGSGAWAITVAGPRAFFSAIQPATGRELWVTDGTAAGTSLVADIRPGSGDGIPLSLPPEGAVGSDLLFFADDGVHGAELWKSDGTAAGTTLLADINPGPQASFLWTGSSDGQISVTAGGRWYFTAYTETDGFEVWSSDGTAAGTTKLKEINDQASAFVPLFPGFLFGPRPLVDLGGGALLFSADDGSGRFELRKSDGTAAGTVKVSDGTPGTVAYSPLGFTTLGGSKLFSAEDGVHGTELWRTNGFPSGTSMVKDLDLTPGGSGSPHWLASLGGKVVFAGPSDGLWVTDGTDAGTQTIPALVNLAGPPVAFGTALFFNGKGLHGTELWRTDGTLAGTSEIFDIRPGAAGSEPSHLTAAGAWLYFAATTDVSGTELWKTDGTAAGTQPVKEIRPGGDSAIEPWTGNNDSDLRDRWADLGTRILFAADDGVTGVEPWVSDGTAAGTLPLGDLFPGARGSEPKWMTRAGSRFLFVADDGVYGRELWASDGTPAGTALLADIEPGAASSQPMELRPFGGIVLFSAWDSGHGRELWVSDGTPSGTKRVQDIAPGPLGSSPLEMTSSALRIFFVANDNVTGFELWSLPKSALGSDLSASKTVSGFFYEGGTVTYQIAVTNHGLTGQIDAFGDEVVDVLPPGLALTGATASAGTVTVNAGFRRVTWNGAIAAGATVTITISATIQAGTLGTTLSNQAALGWDADANGVNETAGFSDDPANGGAADPTPVAVGPEKLRFYTITPCRAADTRATTALSAGVKRTFPIAGAAGNCGIPATARVVAANLTVVGATGTGTLVAWKAGAPPPPTSNLNFRNGVVRGNNALVALGAEGSMDALASLPAGGTVHLVIDVSGYFQ